MGFFLVLGITVYFKYRCITTVTETGKSYKAKCSPKKIKHRNSKSDVTQISLSTGVLFRMITSLEMYLMMLWTKRWNRICV